MKTRRILCLLVGVVAWTLAGRVLLLAAEATDQPLVTVRWAQAVRVSKTVPTLQVVVNPPLRRGSKIHDRVFRALQDLGCEYVRYAPWYPYPKLAVAVVTLPRE
jgi:hypothetical protein